MTNLTDTERHTDSDGPQLAAEGQNWLITGAAGALGSALAQRLAQAGATLVLLDKNQRGLNQLADELEASTGTQAYLFPVDLAGATPEDYQRLAEAIQEHLGELNGCLHTAAHFEGLAPLQQLPATQWWLGLQANLSAPFLMFRELIPLLTARNGRLLFFLDDLKLTSKAFWGTYGVSQWGLRSLIAQWSEELSNLPIQFNGIELPPFRTGLRGKAYPAEDPATLVDPAQLANRVYNLLQSQAEIPLISHLEEALT